MDLRPWYAVKGKEPIDVLNTDAGAFFAIRRNDGLTYVIRWTASVVVGSAAVVGAVIFRMIGG